MRAQDYARALYKYIDIDAPPIRIEPIIEALGIELREDDFDNLNGFAFKKADERMIMVNRSLPPERKRFAIAHELGHIVMPHKGPYHVCFQGRPSRMEKDADRFAAELLMPESTVRKVWERYKDNVEYRVSILAERFEVSRAAMAIRVRRLGLK